MLTTSPACSARQSSSRMVRKSMRVVSPAREISLEAGLTYHSPMRSEVTLERSMAAGTIVGVRIGKGARRFYQEFAARSVRSKRIFQRDSEGFQDFLGRVEVSSGGRCIQMCWERISDDSRCYGSDFTEAQRAVGDWDGWIGCGDTGPVAGVHFVRVGYTAGDRGRIVRPAGFSRWRGHIRVGCFVALLYCNLGSGDLLPGEPQTGVSGGTSPCLWIVFWRSGAGGDEPGCITAVGAARSGSLQAGGFDSRSGGSHGCGGRADRL